MSPLFDCSAFARVTTNPDFRLAGQLAPIFCELNLARTGNPIRKKKHSVRRNLELDMFGTNAMLGLINPREKLPAVTNNTEGQSTQRAPPKKQRNP